MTAPALLQELADALWVAEYDQAPIAPLSEVMPGLDVAGAYEIQRLNIERRISEGRSRAIVGRKIGLTSAAVQRWLGVHEPDFGTLLDDMCLTDGSCASMGRLLQPRVEGEIAFVLGRELRGPGVTAAQVLSATEYLLPAIEIIDSRIRDWKIKLVDTVADNASSAMLVLGTRPCRPAALDLATAGLTLRKNGDVASSGAGAACLGNPLEAVVWLANKLGELNVPLAAGDIVMSGALGPVVGVAAGDAIEVTIDRMGTASVTFN